MHDGLKINSWFGKYFTSIMYLKDPLLAAILVMTHDYPEVQIGAMFIVNFL